MTPHNAAREDTVPVPADCCPYCLTPGCPHPDVCGAGLDEPEETT